MPARLVRDSPTLFYWETECLAWRCVARLLHRLRIRVRLLDHRPPARLEHERDLEASSARLRVPAQRAEAHVAPTLDAAHLALFGAERLGDVRLNKASRLCSIAKPWGVAIDVDDFKKPNEEYVKQRRTLDGLGRVDAWVTQRIAESFLRREVLHECPEVHVAGVCIR